MRGQWRLDPALPLAPNASAPLWEHRRYLGCLVSGWEAAGFHHAEGRAQPPNLIRSGPNRLMHALVRFAHIAAGNTFTTAEIHPAVLEALGCAPECYTLASLRYDRSKLRAKGLVAKLSNSRRYQLLPQGYSICLVFLKLFERVYAPLTAGLLNPVKSDARLASRRRSQLDRLYQRVIDDLDTLIQAVGLKAAGLPKQTRTKSTLRAR